MTNKPERLPMESDEDYSRFLKHHEDMSRRHPYIEEMIEEEARASNDKLIFIMSKVDLWLLRLILISLVAVVVAQIYHYVF